MIDNQEKNTEMDEVISFGYTDEDFNFADPAEYLYEAGEEEHTTTSPDGKKVTIKTPRYAVSLRDLAECACLRYMPVTYAGKLYLYNNNTQLYHQDTGEIKHWVQSQIFRLIDTGKLPKQTKTPSIVDNTYKLIENGRPLSVDRYPFNRINGFPVANGVIMFDGDTITLKPHEVDDFITRKSPITYNPDADTSLAENILRMWLPGSDDDGNELWQYLLQIPAQAIVQSLPGMEPYKKAYMLLGDRDSGKSTYNGVCRRLFGRDNVTTRELQSFSNQFAAGDLVNKYMNFGDDLTTASVKPGNQFKTLVGMSEMTVEQKFRDSFLAPISAVHAYSANRMPKLDDRELYSDDAWWSRWIIIQFDQHFPRNPAWASEHLTAEFYEGFLLLVVRYVGRMLRNHGLILDQDWRDVQTTWIGGESKLHDWFVATFDRDYTGKSTVDKNECLASIHAWATEYMPIPSHIANDGQNAIAEYRMQELSVMPGSVNALTRVLEKTYNVETKYVPTGRRNDDGDEIREHRYAGLRWKQVPWRPLMPTGGSVDGDDNK